MDNKVAAIIEVRSLTKSMAPTQQLTM